MRHEPLSRSLFALSLLASVGACDRSSPAPNEEPEVEAQGAPGGAEAEAPEAAPTATDGGPQTDLLASAGVPVVDLSGITTPPPPLDPSRPRLASTAMLTPVHEQPDFSSPRIGTLRAGGIVGMDPTAIEPGGGCAEGWRKIEPTGFVCLDARATLDLAHPIVKAMRPPDITERLPYMYGVVTRGGPTYSRIPTRADLETFEPSLESHLGKWKRDEVSGASYGLDVWLRYTPEGAPSAMDALRDGVTAGVPPFLEGGQQVPNLSGLVSSKDTIKLDQVDRRKGGAFMHSFLHEGRRYNVSTDLRVIPADRFRPIRGSDFHGWRIGVDIDFPFALVRRPGGKKWTFDGKGFKEAGALEWRSAVALTGAQKIHDGKLYYEAKEGFWVDDRHAGRVEPAKKMPKWGKNGEKWISVRISTQVLVAYEGETPVYATLVSSGEAGLGDPEETTATVRGIFRIHTKHTSITMDSEEDVDEEFELRDVPYVMYFERGYALHGAYWHDGFGRPKSHGCINLAPEDARRLFWWTEPQVPPGWHGASRPLTGTIIFVHP